MWSVLCSQMMDESEACSLPGGLASVKRQFENQEFASSSSQSSVAQVHFEQRYVQVRRQPRSLRSANEHEWFKSSCLPANH